MSTQILLEEERGTYTGHVHPHNGYYAGDFNLDPVHDTETPLWGNAESRPLR